MTPILKVEGLSFGFYEKDWVLLFKNLSFELGAGELKIITGINGAGKTSLLRIITGELNAVAGKVAAPQNTTLLAKSFCYPSLTIEENFAFFTKTIMTDPYQFDLDLINSKHKILANCSSGTQARANLAVHFSLQNELIVLDEPTNFLDNVGIEIFNKNLNSHLTNKGCAVIATHTPGLIKANFQELNLNR